MLKKLFLTLSIILFVFFSAAFAQDADQSYYFPLTKGSFWVYKLNNNVQLRFEATGTETIDGKQYSVISSSIAQDYSNAQKEYFFKDKDGIYLSKRTAPNLNEVYIPMLKKMPWDFSGNQSWEWTGTVSNLKTKISVNASGPENYNFKGGTYKAYKVIQVIKEEKQTNPNNKTVITSWYVKGVGKVKEINETFYENNKSYAITAELDICSIK